MPRLLLLAAIAIAVYILVRQVQRMPPHKRRGAYLQLVFGGAALVAVLLTLAGKMHWVGAALTGLVVAFRQMLPVLIRAVPFLHQWWQRRQGAVGSGQQSEVRSALLAMTLDHESGELSGRVIDGPFKDWLLNEMDAAQLQQLLDFCRDNDNDSLQLLMSYLEQRFPEGFEAGAEHTQGNQDTAASSGMSRAEALAVLGLNEDADAEAIVAAHRSLMQKIHPDRGGNDYLAAKINEAKDFLLKG